MTEEPFIHDERNRPTGVAFNDETVTISLADGRALGMPLYFFPWLQSATEKERSDYQLGAWSVYWETLDEGIDLIAMISGMYIKPKPKPQPVRPFAETTGTT